jgi:hypothetical protein
LYRKFNDFNKIDVKDYIHTVKHPDFHYLLSSVDTIVKKNYKNAQLIRVTIESEITANHDSLLILNLGDLRQVNIYYNINNAKTNNCLQINIFKNRVNNIFYYDDVDSCQKLPEISTIPILFTEAEYIVKNKYLFGNIYSNKGELKIVDNEYITEPLIIFNSTYGVGVYSGNITFF